MLSLHEEGRFTKLEGWQARACTRTSPSELEVFIVGRLWALHCLYFKRYRQCFYTDNRAPATQGEVIHIYTNHAEVRSEASTNTRLLAKGELYKHPAFRALLFNSWELYRCAERQQ
jgi:hypothetical protein